MELDLSKYLEAFATESREQVERLEQVLLQLERTPADERAELLNELFRCAHTLKGMAASMEFHDLSAAAHALEDSLGSLRDGGVPVTAAAVDAMLAVTDVLTEAVATAGQGGQPVVDSDGLRSRLESALAGESTEPAPAADAQPAPAAEPGTPPSGERTGTIRVKVDQLDRLVDLVGELVTVRSRLVDLGERNDPDQLGEGLDQLTQITTELQSEVLQTRMVPVARVFDRFPRTVRALAGELGKELDLEVQGREIELDRIILDALHEPLVHLLRNAIGHGLEPAQERQQAGKVRRGRICLSARREREHVVIEVSDDGRGMDAEALKHAAIERGVLTAADATLLTEGQAFMLVCEPGFSTAEKVTEVSGRGVGMDVVKGAVEAAGGSLEISSKLGEGTTFELHLPVTLAIIRALLVRVGPETYAVPLSNVTEAVNFEEVDLRTVGNREVAMLRDVVLPLLHLNKLLEAASVSSNGSRRLLSLEVGSQRVGVVVDGVLRQQEVVIKPLGDFLGPLRGFAGATILGDGRVVLVLDPASLLTRG